MRGYERDRESGLLLPKGARGRNVCDLFTCAPAFFGAGSGGPSNVYQNTILLDNPILYYRGGVTSPNPPVNDETNVVPDISGNGYNGSFTNFAGTTPFGTSLLAGTSSPSLNFNLSSGGYVNYGINLPNVSAINGLSYPCSMEAWWMFAGFSSPGNQLIRCGGSGSLSCFYASGSGQIYFGYANVSNCGNTAATVTTGTLYHIVLTISEAGVWHFYRNGVQDSNSGTVSSAFTNGAGGAIGYNVSGGVNPVNGAGQEFALYNYALTQEQVTTHYDAGTA